MLAIKFILNKTETTKYNYTFGIPMTEHNVFYQNTIRKGVPVYLTQEYKNLANQDKCIYGELNEKDITFCENKINAWTNIFTPKGEVTRETEFWAMILNNPEWAYIYARYIDCCPNDDTRNAVLSSAEWAYNYARYIDCCPNDDTRNAVLSSAKWSYFYAYYVDRCFREDTWSAVEKDDYWSERYEGERILRGPGWKPKYEREFERDVEPEPPTSFWAKILGYFIK